jgi:transcriptional regulator with XRE-family HTH domain
MKFVETLDKLILERGITRNKLLLDIKVNTNAFVNWEQRGNIPNGKVLIKISQYFKISIDDLLDNRPPESSKYEISPNNSTPHVHDKYDAQLLESFHMLNKEGKERVAAYTDDLVSSPKYTKCPTDGPANDKEQA